MSQSQPNSQPPAQPAARTVRRIVLEMIFVALLGGVALGIPLEMGHEDIGWTAAIIVWAGGGPFLEILRVLQTRRRAP